MNFNGSYKVIAEDLNIAPLLNKILATTDEQWERNTYRQDRSEASADVLTIVLKLSDLSYNKTFVFNEWDEWQGVIEPVIYEVLHNFKNPFVNKCLLPKLKKGGCIIEHVDVSKTFSVSHRLHIPLVTNKDAIMTIGGEEKNMKVGTCYEVNNKLLHSVVNNGDSDRIHLLFDVYERTDEEQKMAEAQ